MGNSSGEPEKTRLFLLSQGVLICNVAAVDALRFSLEVVPSDGLGKAASTAASVGGSLASAVAAGRTKLDSVVPAAGTVTGSLASRLNHMVDRRSLEKTLGLKTWTIGSSGTHIAAVLMPTESRRPALRVGKFLDEARRRHRSVHADAGVGRTEAGDVLRAGNHCMEIKSAGSWKCKILQPSLGQSRCSLVELFEDNELIERGERIMGPYQSGSRPILANIQHLGGGSFCIEALSVDGTHQCDIYRSKAGQFAVEDRKTEIMPGKEYMLNIKADGDWRLRFREGY